MVRGTLGHAEGAATMDAEEKKLLQYLDMLATFAVRDKMTLREMQSCAGRMQRAIMTLPRGAAWIIVPLFMMMCFTNIFTL